MGGDNNSMNKTWVSIQKKTCLLLLLLSFHLSSWGQSGREWGVHDSICISVCFRFDDAVILSDYRNNAVSLRQFDAIFDTDNLSRIEQVRIYGSSSPEGASRYNERLAFRRATSLSNYLKWKYPHLPSGKIVVEATKDVKEAFYEKVHADTSVPQHGEVLKRLKNASASSARLTENMFPHESYQYIQQNIFPFFRSAVSCVVCFKTVREENTLLVPDTIPAEKIQEQIIDTLVGKNSVSPESLVEIPDYTVPLDDRMIVRRPLFAVKTNLLFDLASMLNVELEVPIGKRWSVAGEWIFPWWLWEKKQHCLQVLSGNLEGRYWFGNRSQHKVLTGWFGGLYAGGGLYDLEWDKNGYQGEFFIAMGVSAGYAHPIGRNLRMEYSLGIGYMKTDYRKYDAQFGKDEQWHLIRRENGSFSWFGPTRAKVSLVWVPQFKFYKKGGAAR